MSEKLHQMIDQIYDQILNNGLERYNQGDAVDKKDREGFERVKRETKHVFKLIDQWEDEVMENIHRLDIFPNQVQNTKENMELLLLHSYYIDVRRKRFMELYHSIDYVLKLIK
ncbi:DUF1798 family protein [Salinibacillus xinjiangensis]|nr:DUF1798 family protein [Salinibacillus xinjiangensis]